MTARGADFIAANFTTAAALKATGATFAVGYISWGTPWKDLTRAIVDDLAAAGMPVVLNFEAEAAPTGGQAEGEQAGARCAAVKPTLGALRTAKVYYSFDYDVPPGDYPILDAYLRGVRLGDPDGGLPGCYSNGAYLLHALDAGLISLAWLSGSSSYAGYTEALASGRLALSQTPGTAAYDIDTAHVADFGQWLPGQPVAPKPAPAPSPHPVQHQEVDMFLAKGNLGGVWLIAANTKVHVADTATVTALTARLGDPIPVDDATLNAIPVAR